MDMSRGVQVIFGRNRPVLGKMGVRTSPAERKFFLCGKPDDLSTTSHSTKFGHETYFSVTSRNPEIFFSNFHFRGQFVPKIWNRKSVKQAPHSEQATGHGMHCREILFTPRCSPKATEFPRSVNFSVRRTVADGASKLPNFRILVYFPHTKPLKRTFQWSAYSPGVTSQNDYDFSMW